MRIGLFTDTYPPFINGVSTSVAMLKKALEQLGHEVYVITVNNKLLKYEYDEKEKILKIPGIPVGIYDYRISRIYPISMIKKMKSWNLDVIHSHTEFGIGIFARIFARQFHLPLVHTYHTLYEDYTHYITHGYFEKTGKKIVEYLTKFYCDKTATELIVPTNKIYRLFKDKYDFEKNIHIIPTGIEVERFFKENVDSHDITALRKKLNISKKDFVVIFVGRLAQEKNIEFLIKAHKKIIEQEPNIKLLIVGDGPDRKNYEALSKKEKIDKYVTFNGKAAWEEIPIYYQACDLFASASTSETQGLTVIEAMASEIPPLCIADEAFKTTITDDLNGKIFENEEEYIEQVLMLYKNPKVREKIARQARILAESYSSKFYGQRVLEVYKRAIQAKKKKSKCSFISRIINKAKER